MKKFLNITKEFFDDPTLKNKSLWIGGLPLIIFLITCVINLNSAEKITNIGRNFALSYFGSA